MPIPAIIAAGAVLARTGLTVASIAPLVKPAIGLAKRLLKTTARPGLGSKVTKGPLMLGKQKLLPAPRPGMGRVARLGGAIGAGVGIGAVASHRRSAAPATSPQPKPQRRSPRATSTTTDRKCCPAGTKRMVCFKRGRTKKARKGKAKGKRKFSAKQLANQRRFAAAARARRKRKG